MPHDFGPVPPQSERPKPPPPPPAPPNLCKVIGIDLFGIVGRRCERENARRIQEWEAACEAWSKRDRSKD